MGACFGQRSESSCKHLDACFKLFSVSENEWTKGTSNWKGIEISRDRKTEKQKQKIRKRERDRDTELRRQRTVSKQ